MVRRILIMAAVAGAIFVLFWIFRRPKNGGSGTRDLVGCRGVVEGPLSAAQQGRVRVRDPQGQSIILPAKLAEDIGAGLAPGTEIIVVTNASATDPIRVALAPTAREDG